MACRVACASRMSRVLRASAACAAAWLALSGCNLAPAAASRDEVARLPAPGGARLDAVLVEINTGATDAFQYEVFVLPQGAAAQGRPAARLMGATRNEQAWGANLRWQGADRLRVEYWQARAQEGADSPVTVGGQTVQVELAPGILDPAAPAGGMEYNLRQAATKR